MAVKDFVSVIRGSDLIFNIRFIDKNTGDPFSLLNMSDILLFFFQEDSDAALIITKLLNPTQITVVNEAGGRIQVSLNEANSALLKIDDRQDFEGEIKKSTGETFIVRFRQKLTVEARLFGQQP